MSHTPGPWVWKNDFHGDPIDISTYDSPGYYENPQLMGPDNKDVIGCDEYWIIGPIGNEKEMRANAHLIAAAPDLLEALEKLEWSGWEKGPPTSMGLDNGERTQACPMCRGLAPYGRALEGWMKEAIGHKNDCELHAAIAKAKPE